MSGQPAAERPTPGRHGPPRPEREPSGSSHAAPAQPEHARPVPGRLVLARHGQTAHNASGRLQGQVDIPLNARGREQAQALARTLARQDVDVIVSSPLGRALATAQACGEALGLPVSTDPALLERSFGTWEGLTGEEIRSRWPREHEAWRAHQDVEGLGIEDRADVALRFARACLGMLSRHPGQTVLVVAHGAAITLGISALIGLDPASRGIAGLENCHRSVLEPLLADPEGRHLRLLAHNLGPDPRI